MSGSFNSRQRGRIQKPQTLVSWSTRQGEPVETNKLVSSLNSRYRLSWTIQAFQSGSQFLTAVFQSDSQILTGPLSE